MRDWTATLWPASFRGVSFQALADQDSSGRRLAVHQYPGGETHFVEDMGAAAPEIRVSAYVASDAADAQALALRAAMNASGAGVLFLPLDGAKQVYPRRITRAFDRDRLGLVAFDLEFVPAGAASPLASALQLAQLALDAVGALGSAATAAAGGLAVPSAGWVADDAIEWLRDVPASLDAIRAAAVLDPETSRLLRADLAALYNAEPETVAAFAAFAVSTASGGVAAARTLSAAMGASAAVDAFGAALDDLAATPAVAGETASALQASANAALARRLARLVLMTGYVDAFVAAAYSSRQAGVAARRALVARFDVELDACYGAADEDLYEALQDLRASAIDYIGAVIADLRPIVTVRVNARMPSIVLGFRIYGDPAKGADLVALNRVPNPALMPERFSALAPSAA